MHSQSDAMCMNFRTPQEKQSHMLDLLDVNLGEASGSSVQTDPWGIPIAAPPPRPQVFANYAYLLNDHTLHDNMKLYRFCMMHYSLWIYVNFMCIRYVR